MTELVHEHLVVLLAPEFNIQATEIVNNHNPLQMNAVCVIEPGSSVV